MAALLVNADDFGLHRSVNEAIEECARFGTVNSISVMANGRAPDFDLLSRLARQGIFTGVHVTWVGEPWITEDRLIADWRQLVYCLFTGGRKFQYALYEEAEAQIGRLLQNKIQLFHIDSHQHVHHLPGVWSITEALQKKYCIERIRVAHTLSPGLARQSISGWCLGILSGRHQKQSRYYCAGIRHTGRYDIGRLEKELMLSAGINTELIVHPGNDNVGLNNRYLHWHFNWEGERKAICSNRFLQAIEQNNFTLRKTDNCLQGY